MSITVTTPTPLPWYRRWLNAIGIGIVAAARAIYQIVAPAVKSAALEFVNDKQNQAVAIAAARAAMSGGFTGNAAWGVARAEMLAQFGASASVIADNWLDTLLQTAYFSLKNAEQE
jgi:p-aminobenzoyl-glutamate transporter AbgT